MKNTLLLALLCLILLPCEALAWGGRNHATVTYIAERHLTERAKANIGNYINHRSITYYAAWMDYNRSEPPFDVTHGWHVDYWTDDLRHDKDGNPLPPASLSAIERIIEELSDFRSAPDSLVNVNIRFLAHMIGDMHCPVHIDFPKTHGVDLRIRGRKSTSFHKLWDGVMIDIAQPGFSPKDYALMLDTLSPEEVARRQQGTPADWFKESLKSTERAMQLIPGGGEIVAGKNNRRKMVIPGKGLTHTNYFFEATEIANEQLLNSGLRLAAVLNMIFDK